MVELDRILLVGGTSRIPRIAERVHATTGRPIAVDVHPKHGVALGAARLGIAELPRAAASAVAVASPTGTSPGAAASVSQPPVAPRPTATAARPAAARVLAGSGTASASRRPPWLLAAGIGAALAVVAVAVLLLPGLIGGAPRDSAAPTGGGGIPTLPPAASALPTFGAGPAAVITEVTTEGGRYVATFSTTGFTPAMTGLHVHFFWNTVPAEQAGAPADGPYVVYVGPSPFTQFAPSGRPGDATAICIIVANPDHSVVAGSGGCSPVP